MIQKIIQVGNSAAITISKEYLASLGAKVGTHVAVSFDPNIKQLIVDIPTKKEKIEKNTKLSLEFQQWLNTFLEEDRELLDELANR